MLEPSTGNVRPNRIIIFFLLLFYNSVWTSNIILKANRQKPKDNILPLRVDYLQKTWPVSKMMDYFLLLQSDSRVYNQGIWKKYQEKYLKLKALNSLSVYTRKYEYNKHSALT